MKKTKNLNHNKAIIKVIKKQFLNLPIYKGIKCL